MKHIYQFAIILGVSFLGEALGALLPLPVPASIYGLLIMLALLGTGLLPLDAVRGTGSFLIEIMPVMFIPSAVGLIDSWDVLRPVALKLLLITIVSTLAVMAVSGRVTQGVIRSARRGREARK